MKVSDYIFSELSALGIQDVFTVSGGSAMHLLDSLGTNPEINYVSTHHEQAAAMSAEGNARITGKPGAALVTSGPGGTNTLTFDAAGSDVWATGSVIESRGSSEVTFDISAAGETQLVFTPANAATNLFTTGSMIAFICYETGTWTIASKMGGADDATTGAFAFAA
jgi:hypothetical protein